MKKVLIVLALVGLMTGCRSGMFVAGPVGYWNAGRCSEVKTARTMFLAEVNGAAVPAKAKEQLITAQNIGLSPEDIAPAVGVNVAALFRNGYTWGEVGSQFLATIPDLALIVGAVKGGEAIYKHYEDSDTDSGSGGSSAPAGQSSVQNTRGDSTGNLSPQITGSNNSVQYNFGTGRQDNDGNGNTHN